MRFKKFVALTLITTLPLAFTSFDSYANETGLRSFEGLVANDTSCDRAAKISVGVISNTNNCLDRQNTGNLVKEYSKTRSQLKRCFTWQYLRSHFKKAVKENFDRQFPIVGLPKTLPPDYMNGCVVIANASSAGIELQIFNNREEVSFDGNNPYTIRSKWSVTEKNKKLENASTLSIVRICLSSAAVRQAPVCLNSMKKPKLYIADAKTVCFGFFCMNAPGIPANKLLIYWRERF